eukprot:439481-Rhodomonas_salina.1
MEANDNIVYLEPMVRYVSQLASEGFSDLIPAFKPTMHTLLLIWKNSKFYNTPGTLSRACIMIISRACSNPLCFVLRACYGMPGADVVCDLWAMGLQRGSW